MGSVFLAQHLRLPKQVAVKVLRGGDQLTTEMIARFRREAEIASRLGHPNIAEVLDYDTLEDGAPFLVLEYLRGESLESRLKRGAMPLDEVFSFTRQMASALQAAHRAGIIHRDLKPANVFLVPTDSGGVVGERVKLLDFGISKVIASETVQTQEDTLIGTPQYMSPEQAQGRNKEIDARTDIFALGCIVYEMLAGQPAFGTGGVAQIIYRIVFEPPAPLTNVRSDIPARTLAALEKALSKRAEDRYPDISSFAADLTGVAVQTLPASSDGFISPVRASGSPSGIAMPSDGPPSLSGTLAPGSLNKSPSGIAMPSDSPPSLSGTLVPGSVSGTARMGIPPPVQDTGRMGLVAPSPSTPPVMDPPSLEPTLISKVPGKASPHPGVATHARGIALPDAPRQDPVSVASIPVPATTNPPVAVAPSTVAPVFAHPSTVAPAPASRGFLVPALVVAALVVGGGTVWWVTRTGTPQQPDPTPPITQPQTDLVPASPLDTKPNVVTADPPPAAVVDAGSPTVVTGTTEPTRPVVRPTVVREVIPEGVRKTLDQAEKALSGGDTAEALRLARLSQREQLTGASYSVLTRAYCRQRDLGNAKAQWSKVTSADRKKVQQFCKQYDIEF